MVVRLPVYVRTASSGEVVATSVDFPDLSTGAEDEGLALHALERQLADRLRAAPGATRSALATEREPRIELLTLTMSRTHPTRADLSIRVGLVLWAARTSQGSLYVVRAPAVPAFDLAVEHLSNLKPQSTRAMERAMRGWSVAAILAADEAGSPRLAEVELELPTAAAANSATGDNVSLEQVGEDLTQLAAAGRLGRLDHRDPVVERVLAALAAPGRSSVLLVGPHDVGKTALIGEVAARMAAGDVPPALRRRSLWRVSANELIAGARYIGQWQGRAKMLLDRARQERLVVAMGDPTAIVDAGRWSESANNLSRALRPAMEAGELSIICECTQEVLAAVARKEPSFVDAFHRVELLDPRGEEAARIVSAAAARLQAAHGIEFDATAGTAAIELTSRFEPYSALPGKAVRLLEEVVQRSVGGEPPPPLDREDVIGAFSDRTGLPRSLLSDEVDVDLREIEEFLVRRVLGQPEAVSAMVDLFAVIKAGLHDPGKPLGSYFFVGPTGVGKTELAKALAEQLFRDRDRMVRFDMGEYRAGDAVARLIGSGWRVGEEGALTRRVREQPFCVVLLDEIEKAHPDVFDALLGVLGEGRLTDAAGRTADFRNTIIVMTSNLGAARPQAQGLGFAATGGETLDARRRHFVERAERFFRPEFFNRIDRVVVFRSLDQDTIKRIARREIGRLVMREGITRRQLLVEVDDAVVDHCAAAGFHPAYGARPLQREIERTISQPLARIVVTEHAHPGDLIRFRLEAGSIVGQLQRLTKEDEPTPKPRRRARKVESTIERVARDAGVLTERLAQDADDPIAHAVREEAERLLLTTHAPSFWDDADRARQALARYYQLDRCTTTLRSLERRATGLREMIDHMRARQDQARLPEARAAIEEIENAADLLRLEVAGAAAGSGDRAAVIRASPIGNGAEGFAAQLLGMYASWAERTGRQVTSLSDDTIEISGLASYELLHGEHGLHRYVIDDSRRLLARVAITAAGTPEELEDGAVIVRAYHDGRRQFARDPRTGVRVTGLADVIEHGKIDPFLLETARRRSAERR